MDGREQKLYEQRLREAQELRSENNFLRQDRAAEKEDKDECHSFKPFSLLFQPFQPPFLVWAS